MNLLKLQLFESQIKDLEDKTQLLLLAESVKVKYWWLSLLIGGTGQMAQGRVGRGIGIIVGGLLLGCVSWLLLFIPSVLYYIWIVYDAYSYERDTNNYVDMVVSKRLQVLSEVVGDV